MFPVRKTAKVRNVKLTGITVASFLVKGFTNWNDASRNVAKHESCEFHMSAAAALTTKQDIGDMLSQHFSSG